MGALARLCFGQALRGGGISQALLHGELLVQTKKVRQIAPLVVHAARVLQHIKAWYADAARQWRIKPCNAAQQVGFACAVGAYQCGNCAGCDVQADAVQCPVAGVVKYQTFDLNHVVLSLVADGCRCSGRALVFGACKERSAHYLCEKIDRQFCAASSAGKGAVHQATDCGFEGVLEHARVLHSH